MDKEATQFISRWGKHKGVAGCIKYIVRYFLMGLIASPLVLTLLNKDIWKQLKESGLKESFLPIAFLCLIFSIFPAIAAGLIIWNKNNRRHKLLTVNAGRYKSAKRHKILENAKWLAKDKIWYRAIELSIFPAVPVAVLSFSLLLVYNAPPYYLYPFFACCALLAFRIIYEIIRVCLRRGNNRRSTVPGIVKTIFIILSSLVVLSLLNLFFIKINI